MGNFTGKPDLTTLQPISNDGFWLDLEMAELAVSFRVPVQLDNDIIKTQLIQAILDVNKAVKPVKDKIIGLGFSTLDAYCTAHSASINDEETLFIHYKNAVFGKAKALLWHMVRSVNQRKDATESNKEAKETENYWTDQSNQNIAALFDALNLSDECTAGANFRVI